MMDNLYEVPAEGIHSRAEVEHRAAARKAEIDRLFQSDASPEEVAAKFRAAAAADKADRAAYEKSVAAGTAVTVPGSGGLPLAAAEALLGTPAGDETAWKYGFDRGNFTAQQILTMRQNGMSWAEISRLCRKR